MREPPIPENLKLFFSTSFTTPVNEASLILTAPTCRSSATAIATADPQVQEQSAKINWVLNLVLALVVSSTGVYLLTQTDTPDWLALKVLAVGAIFCAGVLLDLLFKPAVDLFIALGATPDDENLNAAYTRALSPVYKAVLAIYAFALIAAALGVFK